MSSQITVRELIDCLGDDPVVSVRGMAWHVAGVKQKADSTDGSMRVQLKLTRQDPQDATTRRLVIDVELNDTVQLAENPAA